VNFNIHDLLGFSVTAERSIYCRVVDRLRLEYGDFLDKQVNAPRVHITIGPVEKPSRCYQTVDQKYLVGEDWLYCRDSYKVANWKVWFSGIDSEAMQMRVEPNFFASDLIPPFLVTPLIGLQLLKMGYCLGHAAGMSKDGQAVLLTGFGGSGKTSSLFTAIDRGFGILGDDHVILCRGRVLSFPTAVSLFKYNIPAGSKWVQRWKREVELKELIRRITLNYVHLVTKASVEEAFPGSVIRDSSVNAVYLIAPSVGNHLSISEIERSELVEAWTQNILSDSIHFFKYLCAYLYVNPSSMLSDFIDRIRNQLKANLDGCNNLFKIVFPRDSVHGLFDVVHDHELSR